MELRRKVHMTKLKLGASCVLILMCAACTSEAPKKEAKKEEKIEPITGLTALGRMFMPARAWAGGDVQILSCRSIPVDGVPQERAKSGAWEAVFVAPSKNRARRWTYSVIEAGGNLHKGPFAGMEESWSGPRGQARPFLIAAVKTDTDAAYQTALKKATEYEKKFPNKPISFLLETSSRHPNPSWRVIWGDSPASSNFSVYVDATTGEYLETMR